MAEVIHYGETYEAAEEYLKKLSDTAIKSQESLNRINQMIETQKEDANQLNNNLDEDTNLLESFLQGQADIVGSSLADSISEVGSMNESIINGNEAFEQLFDSIETSKNSFSSNQTENQSAVDTESEENMQAVSDITSEIANMKEAMIAAINATQTTMDNIQNSCNQLSESCDSVNTANNDLFNGMGESVSSEMTVLIDDEFHNFSEAFQGEIKTTLTDGFSQTETDMMDVYEQMDSFIDDTFSDYTSNVKEVFTNVGNHCQETLSNELGDAGQRMAENAIQTMVNTVGECLTTTTLGSSITTAMTPVLPAIKATKEVAETINDTLDLFS